MLKVVVWALPHSQELPRPPFQPLLPSEGVTETALEASRWYNLGPHWRH